MNIFFAASVADPLVVVDITSEDVTLPVSGEHRYPFWTFSGSIPGPFIRCRVGDVLEVHHTNKDSSGVAHNIDFHGVAGPGGGGPALLAELGETKVGHFKVSFR